jgi:hypothetical protein
MENFYGTYVLEYDYSGHENIWMQNRWIGVRNLIFIGILQKKKFLSKWT